MNSYQKPSKSELLKKLTPLQFQCSQNEGTEPPFNNLYWNSKEDGIYVDVVSGEPLFSSLDKYDSGTGWPSFTNAIKGHSLTQKEDYKLGVKRVELRSSSADSHLGHLFNDGPKEKGGMRYCINSASLKFIPVKEMAKEGYSEFLFLFKEKMHWETVVVAGGCFWGLEAIFKELKGVVATEVGYDGGVKAESVHLLFDPKIISLENILLYFFKIHDPTTIDAQGNDRGSQYRSAIFYENDVQKKVAEKVINQVNASKAWKKEVVTSLEKRGNFTRGEEYHQNYLGKNPRGYTCHFVRPIDFSLKK